MKTVIFIFTTLLFFNVQAQMGKTNPVSGPTLACSSDCLLGECRIQCPSGSSPQCTCILGSFSSCKCMELVMSKGSTASEYNFSARRNDQKVNAAVSFMSGRKYGNFSIVYKAAYQALINKDAAAYEKAFGQLEALVAAYPEQAAEITNYVKSLN